MRAFLVISLVFASLLGCQGLDWNTAPAYQGQWSQNDCTLLVSAGQPPSIVFSAASEVRMIRQSGYDWPSETIGTCGSSGGYSAAALGVSGAPAAAFFDASGFPTYLKYSTRASGSWSAPETVATISSFLLDYASLAFDSTGAPWVAFCDGSTVKAAKRGTSSWPAPTSVASCGSLTGPSLAISPGDVPCISYVDSTSRSVKLAHLNSSWVVDTVDGSVSNPASWYTSLAFDSSGRPAVAYFGDPDTNLHVLRLKYAALVGPSWQKERILDLPSSNSQYCCLVFAPDGTPWVAYLDADSHLACARKTGGVWVSETVDLTVTAGYRPSIRLDAGGNPAIACVDSAAHNVDYASAIIPRSLSAIKGLPDGIVVRCDNMVASTEYSDMRQDFPDRHYVESPDRAQGILVYYGALPDDVIFGSSVTVTGVTGTLDGERAILLPAIFPGDYVGLRPVLLNNRAIGGSSFNYVPPPNSTGQKGVAGGSGLNNIGLLITTTGQVEQIDSAIPPTWFKIDDGAGLNIKCSLPSGRSAPSGFSTVTGISSCEVDGSGNLTPYIRVRKGTDVR